jgi:transcription initiation factor TFIID TATA-box-binding protein
MVEVEIENIIASASIAESLDLPKIAEAIEGAEYNPDRFPGVVLKFESPRVVVLLFDRGKMMCTGGRSVEDVQNVMDNVYESLVAMNLMETPTGAKASKKESSAPPEDSEPSEKAKESKK